MIILKLHPDLPPVRISTRRLLRAAGLAAVASIRRHFRAIPSRSGFFHEQVAGGKVDVTEVTESQATVTVDSRELAHYVRGGTVRPIPPRKALAIPVSDRARAAGYPSDGRIRDLFLLPPKSAAGGRAGLLCTTEGKRLEVHYVLMGAVTHKGHPGAWPPPALEGEARLAMEADLAEQLAEQGAL